MDPGKGVHGLKGCCKSKAQKDFLDKDKAQACARSSTGLGFTGLVHLLD